MIIDTISTIEIMSEKSFILCFRGSKDSGDLLRLTADMINNIRLTTKKAKAAIGISIKNTAIARV